MKNTIKYGKNWGINGNEVCNNIIYATKIKTLSSYSEDKYYPQAYMEEFKYERIEGVFHFDSDLIVVDSNSDFE